MPQYDYLCDTCGAFCETRPMSAYADPQACPRCGVDAPRALLTVPMVATMEAGSRASSAAGERAGSNAAWSSGRHMSGCGCCSGRSSRSLTAEAV